MARHTAPTAVAASARDTPHISPVSGWLALHLPDIGVDGHVNHDAGQRPSARHCRAVVCVVEPEVRLVCTQLPATAQLQRCTQRVRMPRPNLRMYTTGRLQIQPNQFPGNIQDKKGKGSPYSITEHRVLQLIPVLGSQPAGDVSHKPGDSQARSYLATLMRAATNFAAWWTEAWWVWTVGVRLLPDSIVAAIWTQALLHLSPAH